MLDQDQNQNSATINSNSKVNIQQQEKDQPKAIDLAHESLQQRQQKKQREFEQLKADPEQILEEEEKRQPLCQQE
jgi:hypothetical protein